MSLQLLIRNRHKSRLVDTRFLRRVTKHLLELHTTAKSVELGITVVSAAEMVQLNWQFLRHEGSTDVITFDHTETQESRRKSALAPHTISGELYICLDVAFSQARQFRTSWQLELMRYVVHGFLHLHGHDDHGLAARRIMKREENRLMRLLAKRFPLDQLSRSGL